jgi:hypothetical protein
LATALAIISPFIWLGNASGHDFSFHAASWMDAAAQWREGIVLPRWTDGANHGFGEPRFIFYPPLSWMLGAALGLVLPWIYVPAAFIIFVQTLAGLSAFVLGRRFFPQRGALLCAVFFAANPYALLIVYMRSDFAEQLAMAFFPLLFLSATEVLGIGQVAEGRSRGRSIVFLAITFAAVWLSNAPAGVVASYSLAVLIVFTAVFAKSWRPLLYAGSGLALGFGLAGFYLAPAIHEQSWVSIAQALSSGLVPSQNFLYTMIADPDHNIFNRIASTTALLMIVWTAIFAAASRQRRSAPDTPKLMNSRQYQVGVWTPLLLIALTATFFMVRVSNRLWIYFPKLRFVQFPWRFMSILAIPFAAFVAAAITARRPSRRWTAFTTIALIAVLAGAATLMVRRTWWDTEDIPVLLEAIQNDEGFEGVDEYDPAGDDHTELPEKSARATPLPASEDSTKAPDAQIDIRRWSAESKEISVSAHEPLRLSLRILDYPAWRVDVNGAAVTPQEQNAQTNQIVVPLDAGSSHIVVSFRRTPDRKFGGVLTVISILIAIFIFFRRQTT